MMAYELFSMWQKLGLLFLLLLHLLFRVFVLFLTETSACLTQATTSLTSSPE